MASVVKETSNLYKVTVRYLPLDTIKLIMNSILKQYNVKLEEELKKMDFFTSSGKSRWGFLSWANVL